MWKKNWMLLPGILLVPFGLSADITGQTDWLLLPSGGTYAWDGNHQHPLVGSNIGLSSVQGVGTGDNSGITLSILYGSMNFSSGPYNDNGPKLELGRGYPGTLDTEVPFLPERRPRQKCGGYQHAKY